MVVAKARNKLLIVVTKFPRVSFMSVHVIMVKQKMQEFAWQGKEVWERTSWQSKEAHIIITAPVVLGSFVRM